MAKLVSGSAAAAAVIESPNRKPTPTDEVVAFVDETLDALGAVAVAGRGRLSDAVTPRSVDGLVEGGAGGVVERLVAATGDVVHDADGGIALTGGGVAAVGGRRRCRRRRAVGSVLGAGRGLGPPGPRYRSGASDLPSVGRCVGASSSLPQAAAARPSAAIDAERKQSSCS